MYYTAMCNAMSIVPAAGHEKSDIAVAFGVLIFVSVDDFVLTKLCARYMLKMSWTMCQHSELDTFPRLEGGQAHF